MAFASDLLNMVSYAAAVAAFCAGDESQRVSRNASSSVPNRACLEASYSRCASPASASSASSILAVNDALALQHAQPEATHVAVETTSRAGR